MANRLSAQCPNGSIILNNQQDVDAFDCSVVDGDLTIWIDVPVDLSIMTDLVSVTGDLIIRSITEPDLDDFSSLTSVGGDFHILETSTTHLDGFLSLISIGGDLEIISNKSMTTVNGFSALSWVGGNLEIQDNDPLISVNGFGALDSIGGLFRIQENPILSQINGFVNLRVIEYNFALNVHPLLLEIQGFSILSRINGSFKLHNNPALTTISGLSNLNSIGGSFIVGHCHSLVNWDELSSLTSIGDAIHYIDFNAGLSNIDVLSNLSAGGIFLFSSNPALIDYCGLYPLLSAPGSTSVVLTENNGANPTTQDIINDGPCSTACSGSPVVEDDNLSADPILLVSPGTLVPISGSFSEGCGTHTITIDWGDEDATNPVTIANVDELNDTYSSSYTYTQTGIYLVEITITDQAGNSSTFTAENNVLMYNPSCGSARMVAAYADPIDGQYYHVLTRARYKSQTQLHHRSDFRFYRRGQNGQYVFYFKSLSVSSMVISGNAATISGQGRYLVQGSGWSNTPTHTFSVSFMDVGYYGQSDQIQSLVITEIATGNVVYSLGSPVNVLCSRVKVNNAANCRLGTPVDELDYEPVMNVYPNPFSSNVLIPFELPEESDVRLHIYDMQGRVIRIVDMGRKTEGVHNFKWNATNQDGQKVAGGIYVIKLAVNQQVLMKKVVYKP